MTSSRCRATASSPARSCRRPGCCRRSACGTGSHGRSPQLRRRRRDPRAGDARHRADDRHRMARDRRPAPAGARQHGAADAAGLVHRAAGGLRARLGHEPGAAALPIGVQIIAAPWREDLCLRVARGARGRGRRPARRSPRGSEMDIDLPDVHAELTALFAQYEDALVNNRVEVLDEPVLGQREDRPLRRRARTWSASRRSARFAPPGPPPGLARDAAAHGHHHLRPRLRHGDDRVPARRQQRRSVGRARPGCACAGLADRRRPRLPHAGLKRMRIVLRRLLAALPNLVGVVIITFLLTRALPGDPAAYFAGPAATQEAIEQVRRQLGLDRPLARAVLPLCRRSRPRRLRPLAHHRPAGAAGAAARGCRLRSSWCCCALLLACAIALPLGVMAATRPGSWIDQLCPAGHDRRRLAADLLHRPAAGVRLLLPARLGAVADRPARPGVLAAAAR